MIRAQTFLVILIVLMVIERGAVTVDPDQVIAATPTAEATLRPTDLALTTPVVTEVPSPVMVVSPTVAPSPTPRPSPTPTPSPSPTPTQTPVPPPTVEPTPTERPAAPETGLDYSVLIQRGESGRLEVAFTFDAGEGRGHTEQMLDLLKEYGAVGTFGVTGLWAQQNPDLMQRILDEGHQIINHTWDHSSFTGYSTDTQPLAPDERQWQIEATERQIEAETDGYTARPYFRFPYGDYDLEALEQLGALGYSYTIWWSCDTLAWNGDPPEQIVQRCGVTSDLGGPGAILLLHVSEDGDLAALGPLLQDYQQSGYTFVTIEQLLQP